MDVDSGETVEIALTNPLIRGWMVHFLSHLGKAIRTSRSSRMHHLQGLPLHQAGQVPLPSEM